MRVVQYGCRTVECECKCSKCGHVQTYKDRLGGCSWSRNFTAVTNICEQCGNELSVTDITEVGGIEEVVDRGTIFPMATTYIDGVNQDIIPDEIIPSQFPPLLDD